MRAQYNTVHSNTRTRFVTLLGRASAVSLAAVTVLGVSGCNNAGQGALSGAAIGGLAGLGIGSLGGNAGKGAALGAIVGAVGGAVLGDQNNRSSSDRY